MLSEHHDDIVELDFYGVGLYSDEASDADGLVYIADCARPKIALGQCDIVSETIIEFASGVGEILSFVYLEADDDCCVNYHCAVLDEREGKVYDYTIRQLDSSLSFPYVATLDEWTNTCKARDSFIGLPYLGRDLSECQSQTAA